MKIISPSPVGHVRIDLDGQDALHILNPKSIVAYQGSARSREDRFMNLGGAFKKKKWIRSKLQGPSQLLLGLPVGYTLEAMDIPGDSNLLFDFRHVVMFTEGMTFKSKVLKWKTAWITKEIVRIKFSGPGTLGVLTAGDLATMQLDPDRSLFVDKNALVAYPEDASIQLSVYGNSLASQHMNVQWEIRGRGPVLIQTGSKDKDLQDKMMDDGWFKRILREVLPFGSVYIK
ncbi:AIM24 family protein [Paenibacillus sp. GSMTC-2017]|uniref:AIM24 family protein n=1 Tax=Paenibacillus sp. GSMTC-2017 TaxID=2794350 RepID=UPI0018D64FA1|nr:AIM24 family protein [Paenibacillus sp. GSMTC-2017]MBH5318611.1 AIM24 family protein [Paenibacillus sp. GSMTC-2017]